MRIQHHIDNNNSLLIDCGLFQGTEKGTKSSSNIEDNLVIDFDISTVKL